MTKFQLNAFALCCSAAAFAATAAPKAPVANDYSDYTGTSFVANWTGEASNGFLLSVYAPGYSTLNENQDFSTVNQTGGKINTANPNFPKGWDVHVSDNGSTDVAYYNDKNHVVLDATGDYMTTPFILGGDITSFVIYANIFNADGITKDNSSVFKIEVYDKSGEIITAGQIEALYFAQRQSLDLIEAFGYKPANVGKVKISLIKDDGKVGDVAINSIAYVYEAPDYVLTDKKVTGQSYTVNGVDAERAYFYYLKSVDGDSVSAMSNFIRVDGFLTPTATEATEVGSTGFTANWNRLPKAIGYIVHPYKYETATEDGVKSVLTDDFSKATEGTVAAPVTITDPDEVTATPGWIGRNFITAKGMFGANAGRFPVNLSYVQTPMLNLSANGGKYKIHIKAYGTAGDNLSVYRVGYTVGGALNTHKVTAFDANGYAEDTWEMEDGVEEMRLSIEESKLKKYLIDEISITQETKAGTVTRISLTTDTLRAADMTSLKLTDLDAGGKYGYAVEGMRYDQYGFPEYTKLSNEITVQLTDATGIDQATATATKPVVSVSGQQVSIALSSDAAIRLYSLDGRFVQTLAGHAGVNTLTLNGGQVYVIAVGGYSYKVLPR